LNATNERLTQVVSSRDASSADLDRLRADLSKTRAEALEAKSALDVATRELGATRDMAENKQMEASRLRNELERARQREKDLSDTATDGSRRVELAEKEAEGLRAELARLRPMENSLLDAQSELRTLSAQSSNRDGEISRSRAELERLRGALSQALQEKDQAEDKVTDQQTIIQQLRTEVAREQQLRSSSLQDRDAVVEQQGITAQEIDHWKKRAEDFESQLIRQTKELERLRPMERELVLASKESSNAHEHCRETEQELEKIKADNVELQQQLMTSMRSAKGGGNTADQAKMEQLLREMTDRANAAERERDQAASTLSELMEMPEKTGVGMEVETQGGKCFIKRLLPGYSAARSGAVEAGDELIAINERQLDATTAQNVRDLIVGPRGTPVALKFSRGGAMFEVKLKRGYFGPEHASARPLLTSPSELSPPDDRNLRSQPAPAPASSTSSLRRKGSVNAGFASQGSAFKPTGRGAPINL